MSHLCWLPTLGDGYPAGLNAPEFEEGAGERELSEAAKRIGEKL